MGNDKSGKAVTIALVVIIIGIVGALGYFGFQLLKEKNTKEDYTNAANEFENMVIASKVGNGKGSLNMTTIDAPKKTKKYMDEYEIIGTIEIPKIKLKSAILERTTSRTLQIAISLMYTTSALNKPGNTVLYGHNYRNSLFFSRLDELTKGDIVKVLDAEGTKITYEVYDMRTVSSTDTSFYARTAEDTGGLCELTLSTCTDDADKTDKRYIVFCKEKEKEVVGEDQSN